MHVLWLLAASASAGEGVHATSMTAAEMRPDLRGDSMLLAAEQLGLEVDAKGWGLSGRGGLRMTAVGETPDLGDLDRLEVHTADRRLVLGRQVKIDARGLERLDGISGHWDGNGVAAASGWAGRLWHPETWEVGDPWVVGAQLHLRPLTDGTASRTTQMTVGWERRAEESFANRFQLSGSTRHPTQRALDVHSELQPASNEDEELRGRAGVRGTVPAGRIMDVGAEARWEGLPPASVPADVRSPMAWLAPEGYGVGGANVRLRKRSWSASLSGGPTIRPGTDIAVSDTELETGGSVDTQTGGMVQGSAHVSPGGLSLGCFGVGGGIGASWTAGGGVDVATRGAAGQVKLQAAVFDVQLLTGQAVTAWESRLFAERPLVAPPATSRSGGGLALSGQLAAGTDRLLAPWVRGGVALRGTMDRRNR